MNIADSTFESHHKEVQAERTKDMATSPMILASDDTGSNSPPADGNTVFSIGRSGELDADIAKQE